MALIIERILDTRFEFQYNGGDILSSDQNRLFTDGDYCHFKTGTGANIIKDQNVTFADVTLRDTFGGTGDFTFVNIQSLWVKLKALKFFDGLGTGGSGSGVDRFDELTDTFTYFGNNGKVPVINDSMQKLEATTFYNFDKFTQLSDVEIASLINGKIVGVTLVSGVPKLTLVDKPKDGTTYFSAVGGFDYNDLATQTTPLAYTTGDLQLTNDIEGDYTFLSQPPYGVTSVWDEIDNVFDFSQLSIGDEVFLRVHINVTTTGANQISGLKILFGEGTANEYMLPIDLGIAFKIAGSYDVLRELTFYIGNEDWRTTPAKLLFESDASADIIVYGWHPYIIRKSINILDVNDDNFKTFTVSQISNPTVDVTTNISTVKIGYEGVSDKITNILFDAEYSDYLQAYANVISTKDLVFRIYNKTKKTSILLDILSFSYSDVSNVYYNVTVDETVDYTEVEVNDTLEFDINIAAQSIGQTALTTPYNNADSTLSATNVKEGLDELDAKIVNLKEENIAGTITDYGNVTGTADIDWSSNSVGRYTLTGNTAFSDLNFPALGLGKVKDLVLTGAFVPTLPSGGGVTYIPAPNNDDYNGAVDNSLILKILKNDGVNQIVYYTLENMA